MRKPETIFIVLVLFLSPFLLGAGIDKTPGKYIKKSNEQLPLKVGVVVFSDSRPDEEVSRKARRKALKFGTPSYYTSDGHSSKKKLTKPISYQVYKDLRIADVFKKVIFMNEYSTDEIIKNGMPDNLKSKVDAIIVGNINHFHGYSEAPQDGSHASMGLMGYMMMESMKNRAEYSFEGQTQLTDIKLIDVSNSQILWEGNVEGSVEAESAVTKKFLDKEQVAGQSFHKAINKLVTELSKIEIE